MVKARLAAVVLAATLVAGAQASTGPGFDSDLPFQGDAPSTEAVAQGGQALREAMGPRYHVMELLSALETVESSIAAGGLIPVPAQQALQLHGDAWLATYSRELGEGADLDTLWETAMSEQTQPGTSSVRDYEAVAGDIQGLVLATSRYNQAVGLANNAGGFATRDARPTGTVGLDADERAALDRMRTNLSQNVSRRAGVLRQVLSKS